MSTRVIGKEPKVTVTPTKVTTPTVVATINGESLAQNTNINVYTREEIDSKLKLAGAIFLSSL